MSLTLLLAPVSVLTPEPAPAPPEPVELRWQAPDGCPDRETLRARIEHHLGRPLADVPPGRVFAGTRIEEREDRRFWAEIELRTPSGVGRREVDADTCGELTDGVAIVISLTIDTWLESQAQDPPQPDAPGEPTRPSAPPPALATPPTPGPAREPDAAHQGPRPATVWSTLAARPGLSLGALPFGGSMALALGLAGPHWRLAMVAGHHSRRRARSEDEPAVGVDMRLYTLGIEAGYAFAWTLPHLRLELPARAGVEMGPLVGRGAGVETPVTARPLWLAGSAGAGIAVVPQPWIALGVQADAVLPLLRPAFDVAPLGVIYRVRHAGFRAWAAVELRFALEARRTPPPRSAKK